MTKISKPIVFFGTEDFSAQALQALIDANFPIAFVVTKPDSKRGRGHQLHPPIVKTLAEKNGYKVLQPRSLDEIKDDIKKLDSPVGVLVSYGKIIPQSIIDLFTPGIINVHPSLLPKYRGPSPIESAILHGDRETGVSIMQLRAAMDAGPVYIQETIPLKEDATQTELYKLLGALGAKLLVKHLPEIIAGTLLPVEQDKSLASYCKLLQKADGFIEPNSITAQNAVRKIRAFQTSPRARMEINGHMIIITDAKVVPSPERPLSIECQDGSYISIEKLIAPSGKQMLAEEFIRGYC